MLDERIGMVGPAGYEKRQPARIAAAAQNPAVKLPKLPSKSALFVERPPESRPDLPARYAQRNEIVGALAVESRFSLRNETVGESSGIERLSTLRTTSEYPATIGQL